MDKEQIMREALEEVLAQKDYRGFGEPVGRLVYVQAVADRALGRCKEEPHRILQRKIDSPKTEASKPEVNAVFDGAQRFADILCRSKESPVPGKHYEEVLSHAQSFLMPALEDARMAYIACRRPAELDFMEKCRRFFALCQFGHIVGRDASAAFVVARESYLKLTKSD